MKHTVVLKRSYLSCALALVVSANTSAQIQVPIVQPGAPGQASQSLSESDAIKIADTRFTKDDVNFMQNMIPHHAQAVEMGILVDERTNNADILDIAGRIKKSQEDEISFMRNWLETRGFASDISHHEHMDHSLMGMASPEQMKELADATGVAFDRLFLSLMIPHHQGAVRMVDDLLEQPGSAYDPILYDFVNDIVNDQNAEIDRMNGLLAGLSSDPRSTLKAGFKDAEQAAYNTKLLVSLPKPAGFFDPKNPSNLPPPKLLEAMDEDTQNESMRSDLSKTKKSARDEHSEHNHKEKHADTNASVPKIIDDSETTNNALQGGDIKTEYSERWPLLSFWNTDMAFSKDILVAGNYHGFNIYRLDASGTPNLISSIVCPGGQGDVSIEGNLLIMSVEQTRGRLDCGLGGISEDISDERFRGLRIFDISDLTRPKQVAAVQTCRGSHTHSIVSADDERIVVYNSGTSSVRDNKELDGCIGEVPGDERTALFRIDIIEIPVKEPSKARITSSPAVFADDEGRVAGLWQGGDHGDGTQSTRRTDECHDITVFPSAKIAAGACSGNGILLDISDPWNPERIDAVSDPGFAYWHSATFNNDGSKVIFTDEWGGGTQPRCRPSDPKNWGANAIYSIENKKMTFESYYKIEAPQPKSENCVAHNGSVVPVPGRDIFAQAWYQGGLSIMDFTDASNPVEIAYFDRGAISDEPRVIGGYWSTYWYKGRIYGTEMIRGLDVIELLPSDYLSKNELAAARTANMGDTFNPQQQMQVTWPDSIVVAKAYIDQLNRDDSLAKNLSQEMVEVIQAIQPYLDSSKQNNSLSKRLKTFSTQLKSIEFSSNNGARSATELAALLERLALKL